MGIAPSSMKAAALPLWRGPAVGFEQPFEMLEACHERVQRTLALLQRLCLHLRERGCDEDARQAARDVLRYFDQAAPLHHEDEERHVFPPLLEGGDAPTVALVHRLQREHGEMAADWARARLPLMGLAEGRLTGFGGYDEALFEHFAACYAGHIEMEERLAYPPTRGLLPAPAQAAMGQEMAARRGARPR
ncbi:MAG: hemerythrin domain-containing protein [Burkholderiaceae bacterium]|nr:hemerythrin domain-containing protein [Burkholderiaceae bacterium]